jgi:PTH1 family peptidyl-tRNA hydrolase
MNLSGAALVPYLRDQRLSVAKDLLIVVDDVALPVGRFRLRAEGSSGGHNGLESIEAAVGDRAYARLRIGVGPPADRERGADLGDYVLDRMGKEERALVQALFPDLAGAIETWVREGIVAAMNRYNRRQMNDRDRETTDDERGTGEGARHLPPDDGD